jgi:hypothetical protein
MQKTFTRTVSVYQRDPITRAIQTDDDTPVVLRVLGDFTFRRPTVREEQEIRMRRDRFLGPLDMRENISLDTWEQAHVLATLPYQVEQAPENWTPETWEYVNSEDAAAIYEAYAEGVEEIRGNAGAEVKQPPQPARTVA